MQEVKHLHRKKLLPQASRIRMKFFVSGNLKEVCGVCCLFITLFIFVALMLIRSLILGLQPRDKAAMLGVKTTEFFLEEFT